MAAYATVADARDEGVPVSISSVAIQEKLDRWSEFVDAVTKQWFESRALQLLIDGPSARTIFLPVPVIAVTALYMNGDFVNAVDPRLYAVYNRRDSIRDDRRNPMIKLQGSGLGVFDSPDFRMGSMFVGGTQNCRIDGTFGFLEADNTTPKLIKRAVLKLTIKELQLGGGTLWNTVGNGPMTQGTVTAESTDGHSVTYNAFQVKPVKAGMNGITNDAEVDRILDLYRAPIKIATTVGTGGPDRRW